MIYFKNIYHVLAGFATIATIIIFTHWTFGIYAISPKIIVLTDGQGISIHNLQYMQSRSLSDLLLKLDNNGNPILEGTNGIIDLGIGDFSDFKASRYGIAKQNVSPLKIHHIYVVMCSDFIHFILIKVESYDERNRSAKLIFSKF